MKIKLRTFIISDTHYNDTSMEAFRGTEWERRFIEAYNEIVTPQDTVIHLGDVIYKRRSELEDINKQLNGIKILIRGNHDHESPEWYQAKGFALVADIIRLSDDIVLTHEPLDKAESFRLNIHGHTHGTKSARQRWVYKTVCEGEAKTWKAYYNAIEDTQNLQPTDIRHVFKEYKLWKDKQ